MRVPGVRDEDDARAERDLLAAQPVRVAGAVPALVVVEHPVGDRLDAEALEHPVADLRMAWSTSRSDSLSAAGLRRISSGMASLPRSCRLAASRVSSIWVPRSRAAGDLGRELATRSEWLPVYASRASTGLAKARSRPEARDAVGALGSCCSCESSQRRRRVMCARGSCRPPSPSTARCRRGRISSSRPTPCIGKRGDAGADRHRRRPARAPPRRYAPRSSSATAGGVALTEARQEHGELVAAESEALAALRAGAPRPGRGTRSPAGCPKRSLIRLKSSMSTRQRVTAAPLCSALRRAPAAAARGSAGGCRGR